MPRRHHWMPWRAVGVLSRSSHTSCKTLRPIRIVSRWFRFVMPVREFIDSKGVEWRAWEVTPDSIYPPTRGEDYLADCYQLGWVVLETKTGDRRVRLCPIPADWHQLAPNELELLLQRGERLPATAPAGRGNGSGLPAARSFRYPGGRVWTVSVIAHPTLAGVRVLRFSAGGRGVDLDEWPENWADLRDDQLIDVLRRGWPRPSEALVPGSPRRRWDDPQN